MYEYVGNKNEITYQRMEDVWNRVFLSDNKAPLTYLGKSLKK